MNVQQSPGFPWSPSEAASVNEFLNSQVGRKWLGLLNYRKPMIDIRTTEAAALSGAYSAGYERLLYVEMAATRTSLPEDSASIKGIDPTKD